MPSTTRYDRIPARIESDNSTSDAGIERRIESEETKTRRNQKKLKRRGSLNISQRSGSHDSVEGNEHDFRDGDDEKIRSPFRSPRSYVSDNEGDEFPSDTASFPASPRAVYPSITARFSDSFDLDDDDDDDVLEANLKRYNLDFTATERAASISDGNNGNVFARGNSNRCARAARFLWHSFQSVRQQARQRRAQLLLQQTERNWKQRLKICILTNCDATDSGILLVAATMVLWILVLIFAKDGEFRTIGIILGILLFCIRVGTRPLYHCLLRQRQKRRMRHQQLDNEKDGEEDHLNSDGTLEMHAIRSDDDHPNRQPATSVGSDPTIAAI